MGKKIAFIGTHGTGKTTLAHDLISLLKKSGINADFSEEVSRRCPLEINEYAKTETQIWIMGRQMTEEMEKSEKCDLLVCDRSILDTYSYESALLGRKKSWEPFIKNYLKTYDLLVRVPMAHGKLVWDGQRSIDKKFQSDVDKKITENLNLFKPDYINFEGHKTLDLICKKYSINPHKSL